MIVRCALHVHSHHSFDCFSSIEDLLAEAIENGIDVIAITDHDVVNVTEKEKKLFKAMDVQYICGCEVTSGRGAHIIGLHVGANILKAGKSPEDIVDAIRKEGGIVLIPHPFKPNSGFVALYGEEKKTLDYVLSKASIIEVFNGNYQQTESEVKETYRIAKIHRLQLVAVSDAHKPWRIAQGYTEYDVDPAVRKPPTNFLELKPSRLVLHEEEGKNVLSGWGGRFLKLLWKTKAYQRMVALIPFGFKRSIKRTAYEVNRWRRRAKCR